MTISWEFRIPVEVLPLGETLSSNPETRVKFVRVTISPTVLSPYLWATTGNETEFHDDAVDDPTVDRLRHIDDYKRSSLYRVEWSESAHELTAPLTDIDGTILKTVGTGGGWQLGVNFPTRRAFVAFRSALDESDIEFQTLQLSSSDRPHTGQPYDLTPKQTTALLQAWENGYFELPRETTLTALAAELGISQQALSERLVRAHGKLVQHTLATPDQLELEADVSASDADRE